MKLWRFLVFIVAPFFICQCKSRESAESKSQGAEMAEEDKPVYSTHPKFKDCVDKPNTNWRAVGCRFDDRWGPTSECEDEKYDCASKAYGYTLCGLIPRLMRKACNACVGVYEAPKKWCHDNKLATASDTYTKYDCGNGYGESYATDLYLACLNKNNAGDRMCAENNGKLAKEICGRFTLGRQ